MIQKLSEKGFIKLVRPPGSKTKLHVKIDKELELPDAFSQEDIVADSFSAQTDITAVSGFLLDLFKYDSNIPEDALFNIQEGLEYWSQSYPAGLRVLRYTSSSNTPIAFSAAFPVHLRSNKQFCLPPRWDSLLHRFQKEQEEIIEFPESQKDNCKIIYIPSCQIKREFWDSDNTISLLETTKFTVESIKKEFPNVRDIYTINIHPLLEGFATAIGFQPVPTVKQTALRWLHMPVVQFLDLDTESAILNFKFPYKV